MSLLVNFDSAPPVTIHAETLQIPDLFDIHVSSLLHTVGIMPDDKTSVLLVRNTCEAKDELRVVPEKFVNGFRLWCQDPSVGFLGLKKCVACHLGRVDAVVAGHEGRSLKKKASKPKVAVANEAKSKVALEIRELGPFVTTELLAAVKLAAKRVEGMLPEHLAKTERELAEGAYVLHSHAVLFTRILQVLFTNSKCMSLHE